MGGPAAGLVLPDASGIARQALGTLDVLAVAAGLMRAIGRAAGWSCWDLAGISGGEAWLVVGGQPRVLMMIRLLASAVAGGSPSTTTAVPLGMPVWKRRDRATSSETTKWVSTLPWEGAGNSAL